MPKDSTALCLIIEDSLFFIKRRDDVPTHKGQIAFVGGHIGAEEVDSKITIRREFEEETGFSSDIIKLTQNLPLTYVRRDKKIFPWVAECSLSKDEFVRQVRPNSEWDQYFLVPIKELRRKNLWNQASFINGAFDYQVLFFPFIKNSFQSNMEVSETPILWGATARMVWHFINI